MYDIRKRTDFIVDVKSFEVEKIFNYFDHMKLYNVLFGSILLSRFQYGVCLQQFSLKRPTTVPCRKFLSVSRLSARRDEYFDYDENDDYFDDEEENIGRRRRKSYDNLGDFRDSGGLDLPSSFGRRDGWRLPESVSKALLAGVFILGVGLGVTIDSQVNTNPRDLASRDAIDQAAPNPTLCSSFGASAMAFDERVFVSFNPFNVYISQVDVKPACVLRPSNVVPILRDRKLITDDEVRSCKQNMNTWAFVGKLEETPQLSCVYKSQDAQNEFLSNPKVGIGEDYLDDEREKLLKGTGKIIKGSMTEAQKQKIRAEGGILPTPAIIDQ